MPPIINSIGKCTIADFKDPVFTTRMNLGGTAADAIYTLAVKVNLGQQATAIEVSAAAVAVDTATQTQTMTLPSDVVQNVPLNGRDYTQLISIEPGFGGYNVGGFGSLNGTRPNQMNWQIDGVDN